MYDTLETQSLMYNKIRRLIKIFKMYALMLKQCSATQSCHWELQIDNTLPCFPYIPSQL